MPKERLSRYISNHPFVFLFSLVLITSFCIGGMLILNNKGNLGPLPVSSMATETAKSLGGTKYSPSETQTEIMPASSPTRTVTLSGSVSQEATANNTPTVPSATVILPPSNPAKPLVVTFIDVGQGDSILILSPEGLTALIDGGSAGNGALEYLIRQGITSIDVMIATHPHEDHIGGLVDVLIAIPVKRVITNGPMDTTITYERFVEAIANAQAVYKEVARGDTFILGSLTFSVLNPIAIGMSDDLNNNALVLRMSYENTTFLFMGDVDMNAETEILVAELPVKADILKIGHHGSCESISPTFLEAVQPAVAIYTAGEGNPYGHPCAETINALNQYGVLVLGTDVNGSMIITVTEDGYQITDAIGNVLRR